MESTVEGELISEEEWSDDSWKSPGYIAQERRRRELKAQGKEVPSLKKSTNARIRSLSPNAHPVLDRIRKRRTLEQGPCTERVEPRKNCDHTQARQEARDRRGLLEATLQEAAPEGERFVAASGMRCAPEKSEVMRVHRGVICKSFGPIDLYLEAQKITKRNKTSILGLGSRAT
ncbi:hypothetical protein HPB49_026533 [Dermacentor silvarum]|nr:hypothetical protein HPB49_026533 [Dermacentor silvarum]